MIDQSPAGAWRAALNPNTSCKVCSQAICGHSDLEYAGIFPAVDGGLRRDIPGGSAPSFSSHAAGVRHG